jgi:hypothetical protein
MRKDFIRNQFVDTRRVIATQIGRTLTEPRIIFRTQRQFDEAIERGFLDDDTPELDDDYDSSQDQRDDEHEQDGDGNGEGQGGHGGTGGDNGQDEVSGAGDGSDGSGEVLIWGLLTRDLLQMMILIICTVHRLHVLASERPSVKTLEI